MFTIKYVKTRENETITNLIPLLKQAALAVGHKKYKRNLK
jgi:hypothetical protein